MRNFYCLNRFSEFEKQYIKELLNNINYLNIKLLNNIIL